MIIIIPSDSKSANVYSTLTKACKANKWMKYSYLKGIRLSYEAFTYKGYDIYKL